MSFTILDPTSGPAKAKTLTPRLRPRVDGARVGVIWNGRANGDAVFSAVFEELRREHGMELAVFRKKPLIGNVAPEQIFQDLAAAPVDYVLAGVGD